jgi:phage shock protein A
MESQQALSDLQSAHEKAVDRIAELENGGNLVQSAQLRLETDYASLRQENEKTNREWTELKTQLEIVSNEAAVAKLEKQKSEDNAIVSGRDLDQSERRVAYLKQKVEELNKSLDMAKALEMDAQGNEKLLCKYRLELKAQSAKKMKTLRGYPLISVL